MKVLVVDDKEINRRSAEQTLVGHNLTIVDGWDSAMKVMEVTSDVPYWDAVLTDLLMPASEENMFFRDRKYGGWKFVGQEMPIGLAIALLAAQNGAKYVAVVTATSHHSHPAVSMLDRIDQCIVINGAKCHFQLHEFCDVDGVACPECKGVEPAMAECFACLGYSGQRSGKAKGKNWGAVLDILIKS